MFPDQMTLASKVVPLACKVGGITVALLDSRNRSDRVVFVRHMIAHYLSNQGVIDDDIGVLLNRERTDVVYAIGSFQKRLDTDKHARMRYQKLKEAL